jgi:hypothetical protein
MMMIKLELFSVINVVFRPNLNLNIYYNAKSYKPLIQNQIELKAKYW